MVELYVFSALLIATNSSNYCSDNSNKEIVGLASLAYFGLHAALNGLKTRSDQEVARRSAEADREQRRYALKQSHELERSYALERKKYVTDLFTRGRLREKEEPSQSLNEQTQPNNMEYFLPMRRGVLDRYTIVYGEEGRSQPSNNLSYNDFFVSLRYHDLLLPHEYAYPRASPIPSGLQITRTDLDESYGNSVFRSLTEDEIVVFQERNDSLKNRLSDNLARQFQDEVSLEGKKFALSIAKDWQEQLNGSSEALRKIVPLTVATGIIANVLSTRQ